MSETPEEKKEREAAEAIARAAERVRKEAEKTQAKRDKNK